MSRWVALLLALVLWPTSASARVSTHLAEPSPAPAASEDRVSSHPGLEEFDRLDHGSPDCTARQAATRNAPPEMPFRLAQLLVAAPAPARNGDALARLRRDTLPYDATPPPAER